MVVVAVDDGSKTVVAAVENVTNHVESARGRVDEVLVAVLQDGTVERENDEEEDVHSRRAFLCAT